MLLSSLMSGNSKPKEDPNANPHPDYAPSWGYATESGERVSVAGSQSIAAAYRAKNIISDDVAKMPFQVMRKTGRNIEQVQPDAVTRNMAYLLEVSPNAWGWTPFQLKKAAIEWLLFYGNAYIWSPVVGPRQLLILPASRTYPVFDTDGDLWYRHTFSNGVVQYIPAVEILQLLINPDDTGFVGRGVITFARETFGRRLAATKTQSKLYAQGMLPAAYVQMEGELSAEARKKVRGAYEEQMGGGSENAYRLAVFDKRITKFEPINIQLKDAQFLESIDATDRDVCNFFGLPEHMLNRGKEAYNSNEQKYIEYLVGTLDAFLVPWEQGARIRWLSAAEQANTYFRFIRESLLRMDTKARNDAMAVAIQNGMMTPNEGREKNDMSASDDPNADRLFMASNIQPIGESQNSQINVEVPARRER
ncbi:MAG: phage portal protein, HK97 family [Armatimonadetes bacterium CSP1-3]|nr:MAG: phage portal protein, HK97 family [Armatimonadetes bacterium CSP1-3]